MSTAFLVTGASGFVGRQLCAELMRRQHFVRGTVRGDRANKAMIYPVVRVADIGPETDWTAALQGMDVVIHLAARVHVMKDAAADPLAEFCKVNSHGTENLARQAVGAGVKRLVYVSSIKVNGERTTLPFTESDEPNPQDPYGVSKYEAEQSLYRVAAETGLKIVVVRPPLVYGPSVGGNFLRLLKFMSRGVPLPLASVNNLRSMIYLGNFVDVLITCATHPVAAGKTYLVNDGEDISTPLLLQNVASLMGKRSWLWPFPSPLLKLAGGIAGVSNEVERLIGSLQIDSTKIRNELGWIPPYSTAQGLSETVHWFKSNTK